MYTVPAVRTGGNFLEASRKFPPAPTAGMLGIDG
jgi:hypothetical protein